MFIDTVVYRHYVYYVFCYCIVCGNKLSPVSSVQAWQWVNCWVTHGNNTSTVVNPNPQHKLNQQINNNPNLTNLILPGSQVLNTLSPTPVTNI